MNRLAPLVRNIAVTEPVRGMRAAIAIVVVGAGIGASALLVYQTGGITYVFSHSVYLPIVFAAFLFGAPGGVLAGIAGGIALGPLMPINVTTGEMQSTLNWTYRMLVSLLRTHIGQIQWLSLHDPETEIPNTRALFEEIRRSIRRRSEEEFHLFVIELSNHADIIGALGTQVSAMLTREVVARLQHTLGLAVQICGIHTQRLAFLVTAPDASATAQRMHAALQNPYDIRGLNIYVDTAIGSAAYPAHGRSPEELLQKAVIALKSAARQGNLHCHYDSHHDRASRQNLVLLGELPHALRNGQVRLFYQPKLDLRTGGITGVEALLRWHHPSRGWVPPGAFLPYVENSAMIHMLTIWVLERATEQLATWRAAGMDLQVAVNVSMRNFHEPSVIAAIDHVLDDPDFPNNRIEIEVTESALLLDPRVAVSLFERWRERGVSIAVDDFGTGHASLAYIKDLPVDVLKVDQTFIKSMQDNTRDQAIVRAAIELGRDLGLKTIAEGVETTAVLDHLRHLRCDYAQGYGIQRPLPVQELNPWLTEGLRAGPALLH